MCAEYDERNKNWKFSIFKDLFSYDTNMNSREIQLYMFQHALIGNKMQPGV
jgi:hypothetical protein